MNKIKTTLEGVYILEPCIFGDHRGFFYESYNEQILKNLGIDCHFVQDNHSYSAEKGTLRGIHFQKGEWAQAKLVRCARGSVLDVAVDLRKDSPTYLRWVAVELSAHNKRQLFIPRGFGHGFVTLTPDVEFLYKADNYYNVASEGGYRWDDPNIGVDWGVENPILSQKDAALPYIK